MNSASSVARKQVTIIGINSLFGKVVSFLLKQSPITNRLVLYDEFDTRVAHDVAEIPTPCKVVVYSGEEQLRCAVKNSDVILIGDKDDCLFNDDDAIIRKAAYITNCARAISCTAPNATVLIAATPVNSLLPLFSETQLSCGTFDVDKVMGVTSADTMRASTLLARHMRIPPEKAYLPVIGGSSADTRVPLFSQSRPKIDASKNDLRNLTRAVKTTDDELKKILNRGEALNKAYATVQLIDSVISALNGHRNISEIVLSRTCLVPNVDYFSLPVILGQRGIVHRFPLPPLTERESILLEHAVKHMEIDKMKGLDSLNSEGCHLELPEVNDKYTKLVDNDCQDSKGSLLERFHLGINCSEVVEPKLEYKLLSKVRLSLPPEMTPMEMAKPTKFFESDRPPQDGCCPLKLPTVPIPPIRGLNQAHMKQPPESVETACKCSFPPVGRKITHCQPCSSNKPCVNFVLSIKENCNNKMVAERYTACPCVHQSPTDSSTLHKDAMEQNTYSIVPQDVNITSIGSDGTKPTAEESNQMGIDGVCNKPAKYQPSIPSPTSTSDMISQFYIPEGSINHIQATAVHTTMREECQKAMKQQPQDLPQTPLEGKVTGDAIQLTEKESTAAQNGALCLSSKCSPEMLSLQAPGNNTMNLNDIRKVDKMSSPVIYDSKQSLNNDSKTAHPGSIKLNPGVKCKEANKNYNYSSGLSLKNTQNIVGDVNNDLPEHIEAKQHQANPTTSSNNQHNADIKDSASFHIGYCNLPIIPEDQGNRLPEQYYGDWQEHIPKPEPLQSSASSPIYWAQNQSPQTEQKTKENTHQEQRIENSEKVTDSLKIKDDQCCANLPGVPEAEADLTESQNKTLFKKHARDENVKSRMYATLHVIKDMIDEPKLSSVSTSNCSNRPVTENLSNSSKDADVEETVEQVTGKQNRVFSSYEKRTEATIDNIELQKERRASMCNSNQMRTIVGLGDFIDAIIPTKSLTGHSVQKISSKESEDIYSNPNTVREKCKTASIIHNDKPNNDSSSLPPNTVSNKNVPERPTYLEEYKQNSTNANRIRAKIQEALNNIGHLTGGALRTREKNSVHLKLSEKAKRQSESRKTKMKQEFIVRLTQTDPAYKPTARIYAPKCPTKWLYGDKRKSQSRMTTFNNVIENPRSEETNSDPGKIKTIQNGNYFDFPDPPHFPGFEKPKGKIDHQSCWSVSESNEGLSLKQLSKRLSYNTRKVLSECTVHSDKSRNTTKLTSERSCSGDPLDGRIDNTNESKHVEDHSHNQSAKRNKSGPIRHQGDYVKHFDYHQLPKDLYLQEWIKETIRQHRRNVVARGRSKPLRFNDRRYRMTSPNRLPYPRMNK